MTTLVLHPAHTPGKICPQDSGLSCLPVLQIFPFWSNLYSAFDKEAKYHPLMTKHTKQNKTKTSLILLSWNELQHASLRQNAKETFLYEAQEARTQKDFPNLPVLE